MTAVSPKCSLGFTFSSFRLRQMNPRVQAIKCDRQNPCFNVSWNPMRRLSSLLPLLLIASRIFAQAPPKTSGESAYHPDPLSGMYSFLREGEFVEVDFEEGNRLTGFISRFGDLDSDRGEFRARSLVRLQRQGFNG
jgi:hypothetical protein